MTALSRERVLDAFIEIAGVSGAASASVRALAHHLGVSIGAVQHHYRHREDLVIDAFEETARRIGGRVDARRRGESANVDVFLDSLHELLPLDAARRGECRVYLELSTMAGPAERLRAARTRSRADVRRGLATAVRALRGANSAALSADATAEAIALLIDGAALRLLDDDAESARVVSDLDAAVRALIGV